MTLIVVEGIDGSGKSTLIADLAHQLPDSVHIMRRGPIQRHPMEEYEYDLTSYSPVADMHFLLDRWHIGELIYGPLYRGQSQVSPAMRMHIDMVLDKLGALKILMDTPLDVVRQRIAARPGGEKFLQPQHQQLVWDAYREQCRLTDGWKWVQPRDKVPDLIDQAEKLRDDAFQLDDFPSYIGPHLPNALLLGDRRGKVPEGRPRYPWCFVPYRDTSGHFLLTALSTVDFTGFGLANANEEDVPDLWEKLGEPPICIMGKEALDGMKARYPRHYLWNRVTKCVEHPQYVRRFKSGKMQAYGQLIKETVTK